MTRWLPCLEGFYEASDDGRVRRASTGRELSRSASGRGYLKVSVCVRSVERTVSVHSLVAEAFLGARPDKHFIDHIDGNKTNNVPSNLEYVTVSVNTQRAYDAGLGPSGVRHGRHTKPERTARGERVSGALLTESVVREARQLRAEGWTLPRLCLRFGVKKSAMHALCTRKTWSHVA